MGVGVEKAFDSGTSASSTVAMINRIPIGHYAGPQMGGATTSAPALNELRLVPFWVPKTMTFDRIALEVTTGIATGVARLGIYNDDGDGTPSTLLLEATGTIDTSTTGVKAITINQQLTANLYWLAAVSQTAAATFRVIQSSYPMSNTAGTVGQGSYYQTAVSGALPSPFVSAGMQTSGPRVMLRRSA